MTTGIDDLITACLYRVFGERDDDKRASAIAEIFTQDVEFSDPEGVFIGHDAVNERARTLLDGAPGFGFTAIGPVRDSHDLGVLEWGFGPHGQPPIVTGMDIITVAGGRITTLHTLLTSSAASNDLPQ